MKLIYAPKDAPREEWSFDLDDFTIGEVKHLEKVGGKPFGALGEDLEQGSVTVLALFLYLLRRRGNPGFMLSDLDDVRLGDLSNEDEPGDEPDEAEAPKDSSPDDSPEPPTAS